MCRCFMKFNKYYTLVEERLLRKQEEILYLLKVPYRKMLLEKFLPGSKTAVAQYSYLPGSLGMQKVRKNAYRK